MLDSGPQLALTWLRPTLSVSIPVSLPNPHWAGPSMQTHLISMTTDGPDKHRLDKSGETTSNTCQTEWGQKTMKLKVSFCAHFS